MENENKRRNTSSESVGEFIAAEGATPALDWPHLPGRPEESLKLADGDKQGAQGGGNASR